MYIPATKSLIPIPCNITGKLLFFWDSNNVDVIHLFMNRTITSFIYSSLSIYGEQITEIGICFLLQIGAVEIGDGGDIKQQPMNTIIPSNYTPIAANLGSFLCHCDDGNFVYVPIRTHDLIDINNPLLHVFKE